MAIGERVTEIPDSEDEPWTSSPALISDVEVNKLSSAAREPPQDASQDTASHHQASRENNLSSTQGCDESLSVDQEQAAVGIQSYRESQTNFQPNDAQQDKIHTIGISPTGDACDLSTPTTAVSNIEDINEEERLIYTSEPTMVTAPDQNVSNEHEQSTRRKSSQDETIHSTEAKDELDIVSEGMTAPVEEGTTLATENHVSDRQIECPASPNLFRNEGPNASLQETQSFQDGADITANAIIKTTHPSTLADSSRTEPNTSVDTADVLTTGNSQSTPQLQENSASELPSAPAKDEVDSNHDRRWIEPPGETASAGAHTKPESLPQDTINSSVTPAIGVLPFANELQMTESELYNNPTASAPTTEHSQIAYSVQGSTQPSRSQEESTLSMTSPVEGTLFQDKQMSPPMERPSAPKTEMDLPLPQSSPRPDGHGIKPSSAYNILSDASTEAETGAVHATSEVQMRDGSQAPLSSGASSTKPEARFGNHKINSDHEPRPIQSSETFTAQNRPTLAKTSQEITLAELKAQRNALIASLATLPNVQEFLKENESSNVASRAFDTEPTEAEIMAAANKIVKKHIKLLHEYNEIKDVGQGLMGLIADQRGVRIVEVQEEFGIDSKD